MTNPLGRAWLALVLLCCPLLAQDQKPQGESGKNGEPTEPPALAETVSVSADFLGDEFSPASVSTAVVDLSDALAASSAVEAAVTLPGVSENGQAGLFQVLSVRGISRQRLLSFLDGVRITSERRAGVSASFVDPSLLGQIEVARGPASTYYGSGALGGALHLFPEEFSRFGGSAGWNSGGDELFQNLSWGTDRVSMALAHRQAQDNETPDGETLFSRFEQISGTARFRFGEEELSQDLLFVGSYGDDIGKSSLTFPDRVTIYPRERHGLLRYQIEDGSKWRARLWTHSQDLITDVRRPARDQQNLVDGSSVDLGALFEHRLTPASGGWDGRVGFDYFGRRDVMSSEVAFVGPERTQTQSLDGASVDEFAGYSVINWSLGESRFEVGARWTEGRQRNGTVGTVETIEGGTMQGSSSPVLGNQESSRSRTAATGFLGAAIPIGQKVELVANVGRGLRFPSLTEQFFVGTTGRGEVVGNPGLDEETSTNLEMSLRFLGRRSAWSGAVFRNRIEDFIERVELSPGLLSFVNLSSGRILGAEIDGFVALGNLAGSASSWRLEGSAHWMNGEGDDGATLSDIPANRVRVALVWRKGNWSSRAETEWRASKSDVGPAERATGSALVLDGGVAYTVSEALSLSLQLENLLDEKYFPSADDRAPMAAGRSLGISLRWKPR